MSSAARSRWWRFSSFEGSRSSKESKPWAIPRVPTSSGLGALRTVFETTAAVRVPPAATSSARVSTPSGRFQRLSRPIPISRTVRPERKEAMEGMVKLEAE